jgi:hypothetical protein
MSCDRFREQIPECLAGRLESGARERLIAHLEICSGCRADMAQMGAVWRGLEQLPVLEPDAAMRPRFMEVLDAYRAGMEQAQERRPAAAAKPHWWIVGWWPERAVWQTALALALVLAGGVGEHYLARPPATTPEIAQLRGQVESLRQTVALSMMQDQSASSRIRGVTYVEAARPDRETEQALLYAVTHDSNVNVRLTAVDALEKQAGNPEIQRALVDALPMQDSPLVQIALIDVLVEVNDKNAVPALQKMGQDTQADDSVRQRAASGVRKLESSK